jgi:antitoxin HicB
MIYHFKIHKEGRGFWAECVELEGCRTQGDSMDELKSNMEDAINLYLSEPASSKTFFPPPKANVKGKNIIEVQVAPPVAFATFLRRYRLLKKMTIEEFKARLNIKNMSVYHKLEDPRKANPEFKTLCKIKEAFPDICFDEVI